MYLEYQEKKGKTEQNKNIWSNNDWEFSKMNDKYQLLYTRNSENSKQDK